MRRILIEWLVDVHLKFKLLPETLFIAINLMDRYCQAQRLPKKQYQLLGVTCLLIAGKYEEIYPPHIEDYVNITDRAYTRQDVLEMERAILSQLQFEIMLPSTYRFLERYARISESPQLIFCLAQYAVELSLIEVSMNQYSPDVLASAASFLARRLMQPDEWSWSAFMVQQTGLHESCLRPCARDMCFIFKVAH